MSDWFPTFPFLNKPPSVSNPPWPSPYHVLNSNNMIICPAFGLSMDADAIRNLIIFSETVVSLQVELHAENTKIPSNDGQQQFRNNVGGSQIKYWNAPRHELIWSDMSDLLRGLYNYLVAGVISNSQLENRVVWGRGLSSPAMQMLSRPDKRHV